MIVCPLQNLLDTSNQLHNSLYSCRWPLLFRSSVFKHPDASLNHSDSFFQPWKHHGHLFRLMLEILSFFKGAFLSKFNKISERQLLIMGVQLIKTSWASYTRMHWFYRQRRKCGATSVEWLFYSKTNSALAVEKWSFSFELLVVNKCAVNPYPTNVENRVSS